MAAVAALLDHAVFLLVLLPIAGSVAIWVCSGGGLATVRGIALANLLCSVALAAGMVVHYDPQRSIDGRPVVTQMRSALIVADSPGAGSPGGAASAAPPVRLTVGVDGISLWFLAMTPLLALSALCAEWDRVKNMRHPAAFHGWLLLAEGTIAGAFAARDIVLLAAMLGLSSLAIFMLVGWCGGGNERRGAARRLLTASLVADLLIAAGLAAAVIGLAVARSDPQGTPARPNFDIDLLTQAIPALVSRESPAKFYWNQAAGIAFLPLLVGWGIRAAIFPFYTWAVAAYGEASPAGRIMLASASLQVGAYGVVRLLVPLFAEQCLASGSLLFGAAALGVAYAGLLAFAHAGFARKSAHLAVLAGSLAVLAGMTLSSAGVTGSVLIAIGGSLTAAVLSILGGALRQHYHTDEVTDFSGLGARWPRWSTACIVASLAAVGLPGLPLFPGLWLTLQALSQRGLVNTLLLVLAGLLVAAWGVARLIEQIVHGPLREPVMSPTLAERATPAGLFDYLLKSSPHRPLVFAGDPPPDLSKAEMIALAPLAAVMLALGFLPGRFEEKILPTAATITAHIEAREPG